MYGGIESAHRCDSNSGFFFSFEASRFHHSFQIQMYSVTIMGDLACVVVFVSVGRKARVSRLSLLATAAACSCRLLPLVFVLPSLHSHKLSRVSQSQEHWFSSRRH